MCRDSWKSCELRIREKSDGVQNNPSRSINTIRHSVVCGASRCPDAHLVYSFGDRRFNYPCRPSLIWRSMTRHARAASRVGENFVRLRNPIVWVTATCTRDVVLSSEVSAKKSRAAEWRVLIKIASMLFLYYFCFPFFFGTLYTRL